MMLLRLHTYFRLWLCITEGISRGHVAGCGTFSGVQTVIFRVIVLQTFIHVRSFSAWEELCLFQLRSTKGCLEITAVKMDLDCGCCLV